MSSWSDPLEALRFEGLAGGIKVSMLGSLFGVLILAFAALLWFVLQLRWRLLVADEIEKAV